MIWTNRHRHPLFDAFSVIALVVFAVGNNDQAAPTVIDLTQTGCQFLEPEGQDHHFQTIPPPIIRSW